MNLKRSILGAAAITMAVTATAVAQTFTTDDPVVRRIWNEGMDNSHAYRLAQTLLDSVGPRLTGTPRIEAGNEWLVNMYRSWGVQTSTSGWGGRPVRIA